MVLESWTGAIFAEEKTKTLKAMCITGHGWVEPAHHFQCLSVFSLPVALEDITNPPAPIGTEVPVTMQSHTYYHYQSF